LNFDDSAARFTTKPLVSGGAFWAGDFWKIAILSTNGANSPRRVPLKFGQD
jgi:hypothetical protein